METSEETASHTGPYFFSPIGTLRARSPKLVAYGHQDIVEDPPLLQQFSALCDAISAVLGDGLRLGEIRVTESFYHAAIEGAVEVGGQSWCVAKILELVTQFDASRMRLEANCIRETPTSADACGVDGKQLSVLRAASDLAGSECPVEVALPDHGSLRIPAPDEKAFVALPTSNNHKSKKIDGEITGIGRGGDGHGSRLEVARRSTYWVPSLDLDEAWQLLKAKTRLQGTAQWVEDGYVVASPKYAPLLFG